MSKNLLLLVSFIMVMLLQQNAISSEVLKENGWCATTAPNTQWENQIQRIIQHQKLQKMENGRIGEEQTSYTIPVIVHVVYYQNNNSQNIPAARVTSQLDILNNDFAGTGLNSGSIPPPFAPLKANSNISFCLAKLDMNNNILAEPGIDRVSASSKGWPNPGTQGWERDFMDNTIKKATIWDPNYYLNIWVVPAIKSTSGTLLGYATFPALSGLDGLPDGAGNPLNDGVVIRASYFGNNGTSKGRTTTHEVGHWLGLRHIWGDTNCGTDYVNDTPTHVTSNGGCPTFPYNVNACGAGSSPDGEMFMNFMDYTTDNCMAMFTNGQSDRFQAVMANAEFRVNLANSPVCDTVKQKPSAKFTYLKQNAALCATSQTFDFTDKSLFKPTSWKWTFQGGSPATSTSQNPTNITFNTSGIKNIKLVVTNDRGTDSVTYQINVPIVGTATFPFFEDFESPYFPPLGWETINRNGNPAINWDVRNGYSAYGVGTRSMIFDNTNNDGKYKKDDIQTPKINLTGVTDAKLKFDIAYAPFYGDLGSGTDEFLWDTLEVLITDNCQLTTQSIYRKGETDLATFPAGMGAEFYPADSQWRSDTIVIPAAYLNKPNVQLIFRNYGDYGHTIYVDNINLFTTSSTPTATASFTMSDTTVCAGSSLTFTSTSVATNGGTLDSIRWTINGGIPSTSTSTTVSPKFNTVGTYTISLIAYTHDGSTVIASTVTSKTVRVKTVPNVTVNSPSVCSGGKAVLTASGAVTYAWTPNIGSGASVTTPALTTNTNYQVIGTSDGCADTAIANVTVNSNPTVNVNTANICSGETAVLTASGASTYTWTPNIGSGASVTTPALTTTTNYTVIGEAANGCKDTATTTVTVKPKPTVTVNSPTICTGATATLTASGASTYAWTPNIGSGATVTTPALSSTTSYDVVGTASNGCTGSATATVTVTNTAPTVTITPNPASVCEGTAITLTASGADNYTWTSSQTGSSNGNTLTFTPTGDITVNMSGSLTGCGTSGTTSVTVTVKPKPTVTVNAPSICSGATATLTASGASTYTWTPNIGSGATVTTPTLNSNTNYTVVGNSNGCLDTASTTVTVNAKPATPTITQNAGSDTIQSSTIVAGATYEWYKEGVLVATTNVPKYVIDTTGIYTVKVISLGCTSQVSANFNAIYTAIKVKSNVISLLDIYPNPTDGKVTLTMNLVKEEAVEVGLYTLEGRAIYNNIYPRTRNIQEELNMQEYAKGVYVLKLKVGEEHYYHKVVKQ